MSISPDVEAVGTFLSKEERDIINLEKKYHLFPTLIKSNDIYNAANTITEVDNKFTKGGAAKIGIKQELLNRAQA